MCKIKISLTCTWNIFFLYKTLNLKRCKLVNWSHEASSRIWVRAQVIIICLDLPPPLLSLLISFCLHRSSIIINAAYLIGHWTRGDSRMKQELWGKYNLLESVSNCGCSRWICDATFNLAWTQTTLRFVSPIACIQCCFWCTLLLGIGTGHSPRQASPSSEQNNSSQLGGPVNTLPSDPRSLTCHLSHSLHA